MEKNLHSCNFGAPFASTVLLMRNRSKVLPAALSIHSNRIGSGPLVVEMICIVSERSCGSAATNRWVKIHSELKL